MWNHCHERAYCNTVYLLSLLSAVLREEANGFSAGQEIPRILWNRIDRCPPPVLILSQINPVHAPIRLPEGYNIIRLVNGKACLGETQRAYLVSELFYTLVFRCFEYFVATLARRSARSPFVTLLSRRAQTGRWSSFGKRVWFTESHTVLITYFLLVLFTQFIGDKLKKYVLYQVKHLNHILLK